MRVARFVDPGEFLAASAWIASRGEASASVFRSAAHALERGQIASDEPVYLATFGEGGVALRRGDGPLIIGQSDAEAAEAFAEDLVGEAPLLSGVVGGSHACEAFARRWHRRTGKDAVLRRRMRQHALSHVADVPVPAGAPRVARKSELPLIVDAQCAFVIEVGLLDPPARTGRMVRKWIARGGIRVWDDAGLAAYAGYADAGPAYARIAPVYTWPERRRRGYATALVAALARELMAQGKRRLFLTTDLANPTSNAIYARIGFLPETDEDHLEFVDGAG